MDETVLLFENVHAGYGRNSVLQGLSFQVRQGEIFGVIGPNGSGKTTMLNVLTGILQPESGRILFCGIDMGKLSVDARCRMGIGRTFQIPRPFTRMTVFENVLVSAAYGTGRPLRACSEAARDVLRLTGLEEHRSLPSGRLTLLDRKRLEIARAVAARPRLILLDEVAAGLTGEEAQEVIRMTRELKRAGFTVIWIEHVLEAMLQAADRLMCLADGKCAALGRPKDVITSETVERLYLGNERAMMYHAAD